MSSQSPVSVRQHNQQKSLRKPNEDQALVPSPCARVITLCHALSHRQGTARSPVAAGPSRRSRFIPTPRATRVVGGYFAQSAPSTQCPYGPTSSDGLQGSYDLALVALAARYMCTGMADLSIPVGGVETGVALDCRETDRSPRPELDTAFTIIGELAERP